MKFIPRIKITISYKEIIQLFINFLLLSKNANKIMASNNFISSYFSRYPDHKGTVVSKARIAFYLLLKNLKLKQGGEVIISALHIADFINMIRLAGFTPIVVDLLPNSLSIDLNDLKQKINDNTSLILITHLAGYPQDMTSIMQIASDSNIPVVEDCSQSINTKLNGQMVGTFGVASIFSLSLLKSVSTLFGGFVISKNQTLLDDINRQVSSFKEPSKGELLGETMKNLILKIAVSPIIFRIATFPTIKITAKISDIFAKYQKSNKTVELRQSMPETFFTKFTWQQAYLGISQLGSLQARDTKKIAFGKKLYQSLKNLEHIVLPEIIEGAECSFWLFPIMVKNRKKFILHLTKLGIDSAPMLLSCLAEEPAFKNLKFNTPNAARTKEQVVFIPIYPELGNDAQDKLINAVQTYNPAS